MTTTKINTQELGIDFSFLDKLDDPAVRVQVRREFLGWCLIYLPHYFTLSPADFHGKLIKELTDDEVEMLLVIGFRGSAKSVFCSLAFPLFCALEEKYRFIVVINDTGTQVEVNISNIKYELENNELILRDYGITYDPNTNWSTKSLLLLNDCFILGRSRGQKVRGLRHRQFRPQVIVIDDAEDTEWVKKKVNRDKTESWFNSEVVPAQQEDKFKLVVIGNLLHKNALMLRLKKRRRADGTRLFKSLSFPLITKTGHVTWRAKYPTDAHIQKQKEKIGSETAWAREYLLKIISDKDAVIKETDIQYYDNSVLTDKDERTGRQKLRIKDAGVGNDLAISEEETADFTAFVAGYKVAWTMDEKGKIKDKILILPNPSNKHNDFDDTIKEAERIDRIMPAGTKFFVEDVQFQKSALQVMKKKGLSVHAMRPITDKKARLETVAPYIKADVLFPRYGCEELLEQLLGFGTEEHDDLVDALVYLILGLMNRARSGVAGKSDQM